VEREVYTHTVDKPVDNSGRRRLISLRAERRAHPSLDGNHH
jgi:hypothetical protein